MDNKSRRDKHREILARVSTLKFDDEQVETLLNEMQARDDRLIADKLNFVL